MALGMSDEMVEANVAAMSVVDKRRSPRESRSDIAAATPPGLEFGYLEQGRIGDAEKVLAEYRDDAVRSSTAARHAVRMDPDDSRVSVRLR